MPGIIYWYILCTGGGPIPLSDTFGESGSHHPKVESDGGGAGCAVNIPSGTHMWVELVGFGGTRPLPLTKILLPLPHFSYILMTRHHYSMPYHDKNDLSTPHQQVNKCT